MYRYRSLAARIHGANTRTQSKLEDSLESVNEDISTLLEDLTPHELEALDCWQDGILPGHYEVDHEAIMDKPYRSIRKIIRYDEERTVGVQLQPTDEQRRDKDKLQAFLGIGGTDCT